MASAHDADIVSTSNASPGRIRAWTYRQRQINTYTRHDRTLNGRRTHPTWFKKFSWRANCPNASVLQKTLSIALILTRYHTEWAAMTHSTPSFQAAKTAVSLCFLKLDCFSNIIVIYHLARQQWSYHQDIVITWLFALNDEGPQR